MDQKRISIIAALGAKNRALGKDNELLWHIPDDLKRFKTLTDGHPVIMGRKTWESLPLRARPLPNRTNIVITRQPAYDAPAAVVVDSLEIAFEKARESVGAEEIFVMGGGEIYREALPHTDRLYLTLIDEEKDGDVFFPKFENEFKNKIEEELRGWENLKYSWVTFEK